MSSGFFLQAKKGDPRIVQDIKSRHVESGIIVGVVRLRKIRWWRQHKKPQGHQGVTRQGTKCEVFKKTVGKGLTQARAVG